MGISFGGYFAPRAAAFEKRIKACIANGGVYDFHLAARLTPEDENISIRQKARKRLTRLVYDKMKTDPSFRWSMGNGMFTFHAKSPSEWLKDDRDSYTMKDVAEKITCPVLIVDSEEDKDMPGQAKKLYEAERTQPENRSAEWIRKSDVPGAVANPCYVSYHDDEWGVPVHDDRRLFEFLILEGAQAGLSWFTILKKRELPPGLSTASMSNGSPPIQRTRARLLADPGIVRTASRSKRPSGTPKASWKSMRALVLSIRSSGAMSITLPARTPGNPGRTAGPTVHPTAEQGPEEAGVQLRRLNHLLCLHAGRRHGQRPHDRLFPI